MKREVDLGRRGQKVMARVENEGQAASQHFYEWEKPGRLPSDESRGGGNGGTTSGSRLEDQREDRRTSQLRRRWTAVKARLEADFAEVEWLLNEAQTQARNAANEKHRTPAQVEAEGWCGNHWKHLGELVPVTLRPSGEPWYRGRCRFCGAWPEGDPPRDVLETRAKGSTVRVKAS